jgi:hypothetical protein
MIERRGLLGGVYKQSEVEMAENNDELFDEDEGVEDFDRLSDLLFLRISEFAEEEDVADEVLPLLLLRLSLTMRMMNYVVSVEKPSGFGLKLDLDRYRRDSEELIREMKKDADQFIAQAKETIAAAEQEEAAEHEKDEEDRKN